MQPPTILFYVHWVPIHNAIPQQLTERLATQLAGLGGWQADPADLVFGRDGAKICYSLSVRGRDFKVAIYDDGIFLAQTSVAVPVGTPERQRFCYDCGEIYSDLRDTLHVHLFNHRLTDNFPLSDVISGSFQPTVVRKAAIKSLYNNYLRELADQLWLLGNARNLFVKSLRETTESVAKFPWGWLMYLFRGLPLLLQKRSDLCSVLVLVSNAQGVQSYVDAFAALTSPQMAGAESRGFPDAMAAYQSNMTEFRETIGTFTIQILAITLAMLGLTSPFMIVFFSHLVPSLGVWWKTLIFALFIGVFYGAGLFATARLAKRTDHLTDVFFQ
jgi:hypothetical protein